MSIVVICPSRNRPDAAKETYDSFKRTTVRDDTELLFAVDVDDRSWPDYDPKLKMLLVAGGSMGKALNEATQFALNAMGPTYIGMVGDDNRFRSAGWDVEIHDALDGMGGGVAYGEDLWHHDALPTAWFVSASIVRALGWMAMPTLTHLYMDNVWMTIGRGMGHYRYVPKAVIEHLHPSYGKNEWDDSYRLTNSPEMYERDRLAFEQWHNLLAPTEIEIAKAAL